MAGVKMRGVSSFFLNHGRGGLIIKMCITGENDFKAFILTLVF
jgi:hypothetical protein